MAKLTGKLGEWELPHVHMWKERGGDIRAARTPLIGPKTRIATIGSCFAEELAGAMARLGLDGAMHPGGLFYNTRSMRQELERSLGDGWAARLDEPPWRVAGGYVHPFKSYRRVCPTQAALAEWSDALDAQADALLRRAEVVVVTVGLIEAWMQPATGSFYRELPHPEVFAGLGARFVRLGVAEMVDDLARIRELVVGAGAKLIVTVSPVPLHATLTPLDVRVANCESKSRIRAAVSELCERFPDVCYFHSYEIVATAERQADFFKEDGRHVEPHAVDYILAEFMRTFGADGLAAPGRDASWLDRLRAWVAR